eukprot:scaffold2963_cov250-Pinguiococcus_pyrenoidosus.AAC.16
MCLNSPRISFAAVDAVDLPCDCRARFCPTITARRKAMRSLAAMSRPAALMAFRFPFTSERIPTRRARRTRYRSSSRFESSSHRDAPPHVASRKAQRLISHECRLRSVKAFSEATRAQRYRFAAASWTPFTSVSRMSAWTFDRMRCFSFRQKLSSGLTVGSMPMNQSIGR